MYTTCDADAVPHEAFVVNIAWLFKLDLISP